MKKLLALLLILAAVRSPAPTLDNPFTTNQVVAGTNIVITVGATTTTVSASGSMTNFAATNLTAGVWTNDGAFVYLKNTGTNDTSGLALRIPPFVFRTDGSLFMGTNVGQDVNETDLSTYFPLYHINLTSSNQPAKTQFKFGSVNDEGYESASQVSGQTLVDPNHSITHFSFDAYGTNNGRAFTIHMETNGSSLFYGSGHNPIAAWQVSDDGNMSVIRTQTYVWPGVETKGVLQNTNGTGGLQWAPLAITNLAGGIVIGTNVNIYTNAAGGIVINGTVTNGGTAITNLSGGIVAGTNIFLTTNAQGGIVVSVITNNLVTSSGPTNYVTTNDLRPLLWQGPVNVTNILVIDPAGDSVTISNNTVQVLLTNAVTGGGGVWLTNNQVRLFDTNASSWMRSSNSDLRVETGKRVFITNNVTVQQLGTNSSTHVFDANDSLGNTTVSIASTGTVVMAGSTNRNVSNKFPATLTVYGHGDNDGYANPGLIELNATNSNRLLSFSEFSTAASDFPYLYFWGSGAANNQGYGTFNYIDRTGNLRYGYQTFALDANNTYFAETMAGDNGKFPALVFGNGNAYIDNAHIQAVQGTATWPALSFTGKTNDGFYIVGGGTYGLTVVRNSQPVATFYDDVSTARIVGFYLTNTYGLFWSTNIPASAAPSGGHIDIVSGFFPSALNTLTATNNFTVSSNMTVGGGVGNAGGGLLLNTNWPPSAALLAGQSFVWNSNGTPFAILSTPASTAWTYTNQIAPQIYSGTAHTMASNTVITIGHTMLSTNYTPSVHLFSASTGLSAMPPPYPLNFAFSNLTTTTFTLLCNTNPPNPITNLLWTVTLNP